MKNDHFFFTHFKKFKKIDSKILFNKLTIVSFSYVFLETWGRETREKSVRGQNKEEK